jgi:DNA-binding PadR family transcriptional regulator
MPAIDDLMPLKPAWFHILLALGEQPLHGFGVRDAVLARTAGRVTLWPATLYGSIADMCAAALIEPLAEDAEPGDDARRRYYRITSHGRRLLHAEGERLAALASAARALSAPEQGPR